MSGLCDIGCVKTIMIWNIFEVVVLQRHKKIDERFRGDLELLNKVPLLEIN